MNAAASRWMSTLCELNPVNRSVETIQLLGNASGGDELFEGCAHPEVRFHLAFDSGVHHHVGHGTDRFALHLNFVPFALAQVGELQRIVHVPQVHVLAHRPGQRLIFSWDVGKPAGLDGFVQKSVVASHQLAESGEFGVMHRHWNSPSIQIIPALSAYARLLAK